MKMWLMKVQHNPVEKRIKSIFVDRRKQTMETGRFESISS